MCLDAYIEVFTTTSIEIQSVYVITLETPSYSFAVSLLLQLLWLMSLYFCL